LDSASFNQCYNFPDAQKAADDWIGRGEKAGVTVTPTFFINGQKQEGSLPFDEFKKLIDEKLK
jgi:protein-disulfide isomerase